jgi:hypothetical protein
VRSALNKHLENLLARQRALQSAQDRQGAFGARLRELCLWQTERLAHTYADLRRDPRYEHAVEFFLNDLYGPRDFARRDEELARAWRYLKSTLPGLVLSALSQAIELQILTRELDGEMVGALAPGAVTGEAYAAAYRAVGRRRARLRQIALVIGVGEQLDRVCRHAWIEVALRVAHRPAHAAGFGVLQDLLERGFEAFRHMKGAEVLLRTIRERETRVLRALFAGRGASLDVEALEASPGNA